jgi:hypothetical protein
MSDTICTATRADGQPCRAYAVKGSSFCLFHDPAHQEALAASRSQGGATPRRRTRRLPRLLDHMHVAEILGELLVAAMNEPGPADPRRVQALTGLARVLLKAVGTPPKSFLVHRDRGEPALGDDHLLRVYPALPPEVEGLLEAESAVPPQPPAHAAGPSPYADHADSWLDAAEFLPFEPELAPEEPAVPAPPSSSSAASTRRQRFTPDDWAALLEDGIPGYPAQRRRLTARHRPPSPLAAPARRRVDRRNPGSPSPAGPASISPTSLRDSGTGLRTRLGTRLQQVDNRPSSHGRNPARPPHRRALHPRPGTGPNRAIRTTSPR